MNGWIRIGRFEFYGSPRWFEFLRGPCGCTMVSIAKIGCTFLARECRPSQGDKFFQYSRYDQ